MLAARRRRCCGSTASTSKEATSTARKLRTCVLKGQRCWAARPRRTSTGRTRSSTACRMGSTAHAHPIGWTIRTLATKLQKMLGRAGYPQIAEIVDMAAVTKVLPDVEACARELRATKRNTVKHNRGT